MSKIVVTYKKDLRTHCQHDNGDTLITDGPKELQGLGEHFSPTDLFATSLASCMLTLMGLAAKKLKVDLKETVAIVEKTMSEAPPRRIATLTVIISSPLNPDENTKKKLEEAALTCPVHLSLHPSIIQTTTFRWNVT